MISASLIDRLDAQDRALFARWASVDHASLQARRGITRRLVSLAWRVITHLGGATATLSLTLGALLFGEPIRSAGFRGFLILALSHGVAQLIKRSVSRPRPVLGEGCKSLVEAPDQFSFPSGHAAAAMSVALAYAVAFPVFALPFLLIACCVGISRVYLGVHYPGDVLIGQVIALAVGAGVLAV